MHSLMTVLATCRHTSYFIYGKGLHNGFQDTLGIGAINGASH